MLWCKFPNICLLNSNGHFDGSIGSLLIWQYGTNRFWIIYKSMADITRYICEHCWYISRWFCEHSWYFYKIFCLFDVMMNLYELICPDVCRTSDMGNLLAGAGGLHRAHLGRLLEPCWLTMHFRTRKLLKTRQKKCSPCLWRSSCEK